MTRLPATAEPPPQRLARRATATGVGFLVLMPAWQLGLRLASLAWQPPLAPLVAMAAAITAAVATAAMVGRRLNRARANR